MTAQADPVRWSIASSAEIERTARELMHVRERYLAAPTGAIFGRPVIRRSWERCRSMQVDAAKRAAPLYVASDSQVDELLSANEKLLRAAKPVMARLAEHLSESGYAVVVADAAGRILAIAGDRAIRKRLARIDFMPGGEWSEAAAGTNAIGTALADGRSVQLMAAEHFCDGWTNLTCTAVPIRNPADGSIAGVLDLTGDYRLIRSHLIALVTVNAREIEERLRNVLEQRPGLPMKPARHDELAALAGVTVGASLDINATLGTVAEQAGSLLQLDRTTVCLFAAEPVRGMRYRCWSRKGSATYSKHTVATFLSHCAAVAQLRERGDPIICDDATTLTVTPALLAQRLGIRAMLLVPLATARGVMGFIGALREDAHHWQVDELRRACALAAQAATAIENALLFEALQKRNRHVEAINEIAGLMSRLPDPERRLDEILGAIVKIMGQDCGVLFVRPEGGDRVRPAAHYGAFDPDLLGAAREALRPDDARIARRGAPDEASLNVECQEVLVVALDDGPTSLGRLEIGNHSGSRLSVDDLNTLAAIGRHLCMALKNQRLLRSAGEFDALRQADALKSEFLATVSHDLRSPLTAIRASVDGLLDPRACRPVGEAEDLLLNISSEATRLGRLVDQLLDVSQIEAGRLSLDREWNELPGLLKDATRAMAALYTSHRIVYDIPAGAPVLYVDRDRFTQVVCNLLDNACKYAPPAKPIVVEARWTESEIRVSVIDGGPGVPSADREKIFARFYRGDRRKAGVRSIGLGLAISRGIVEAHGGRIWVDGDSGGSAFRFTMPLVDDRAGALAAGYDG